MDGAQFHPSGFECFSDVFIFGSYYWAPPRLPWEKLFKRQRKLLDFDGFFFILNESCTIKPRTFILNEMKCLFWFDIIFKAWMQLNWIWLACKLSHDNNCCAVKDVSVCILPSWAWFISAICISALSFLLKRIFTRCTSP